MASESGNGEYIFDRLPSWMPSDPESGNYKLLDVVGRAFDRIEQDVRDVDDANNVQDATSIPQLNKHGELMQVAAKDGESLEKYRARTMAEYQTVTSEGTPRQIIRNTATILNIGKSHIDYAKLDENGVAKLSLPDAALDESTLTGSELVDIIGKQAAAGFRIEVGVLGSFENVTPSDYNNANMDSTKGYDGLDANGDPKNNGGKYAGLI